MAPKLRHGFQILIRLVEIVGLRTEPKNGSAGRVIFSEGPLTSNQADDFGKKLTGFRGPASAEDDDRPDRGGQRLRRLRHAPPRTVLRGLSAPLGFRHFAGIGVRNGDDIWAVTLQRFVDDEPFSGEEQARLATLIEPLQNAVKVGQALADADHQGGLDRLDVSATACVLLDRLGLVAHMNHAAEALLGTTLAVRQGFIGLPTAELTNRLQTRIQKMLSPPDAASREAPSPPLVERGPHGIFVFEVLRLPDMDVDVFGHYRCMLLIHHSGGPTPLNVEAFRSMFALTRQEAALVDAVAIATPDRRRARPRSLA